MRTPDVSDEEIIAAGEQLRKDSRRVTGFALRKQLGGGNANRLITVWEEHLSALGDNGSGEMNALPVELEETLKELLGGFEKQIRKLTVSLNDRATKIADRRVAEVTEKARETTEKAEAELADAASTVGELEEHAMFLRSERAQTGQDLRKAHQEVVELKGTVANLERDLAIARNERDSELTARKDEEKKATALAKEVDKEKARANSLEKDLSKANQTVETWRQKSEAQQETITSLTSEVEGLSTEKDSLSERLRNANAEHEKMKADLMEARTDARLRKEQMDDLMGRISIRHRQPYEGADEKAHGDSSS